MLNLLAYFFGYIINFIFNLINNYGITIIIFTILSKLILFPLNILVQKNSIKIIKIKPELEELKLKYQDDKDTYMEEQLKLYKKEKYRPSLGLIPLLIQIVILMGLTKALSNTSLYIPDIVNTSFGNFDLSVIPKISISDFNFLIIIIIGISTLLLCYFQNKENVLQIEESRLNKFLTTVLTVVITVYFSMVVPVGVSLYWSIGNIFAIIQLYLLNYLYNPCKYIDYDKLNKIKNILEENKNKKNENKLLEKESYKKFFQEENKEIIFYSESSGFYKYFKPIIMYIVNNSDIIIHYITSDPHDKIFELDNTNIKPYYIGTNKLISLFMKIDSDIVIMTTPDLQKYYLKRSLVRKDIEYIFTDHGLTSYNLAYREGSLDYFDTIFSTTKQQTDEIRAIEELRKTKRKNIVETGYCLIDEMIKDYKKIDKKDNNNIKTILIAPSWQEDNIMDSCLDEILDNCLNKGIKIIVRPHPQYIKRNPIKIEELMEKYKNQLNENFKIELDFSSNETVYNADVVITDWSGIGYEFAFTTTKPCIFINTKIKIVNPEYDEIDVKPLDITLRNVIGKCIEKNEVNNIFNIIIDLIDNQEKYKKINEKTRIEYLYNLGNSAEVAGKYIIKKIGEKRNARLENNME